MNAEREMIAILKDIRDLVQVLVMRDSLSHPPLGLPDILERNVRSWSLSAHATPPQKTDDSDDPNCEPV